MNAQVFGNGGAGMAQPNASARMVGKFGLGAAALGMAAFGAGMLASNGVAPANTITVLNASFESPAVTGTNSLGGGTAVFPGTDTVVTDWGIAKSNSSYTPVGVQNIGGSFGQVLYDESVADAIVYQDVGALTPNTAYTLSVVAGNSSYANADGGTATISLYNTTADSNTSTQSAAGTLLRETTISNIGQSMPTYTVNYTSPGTVTGDLTIELALTVANGSAYHTRVFFDNVSLAAVPEPASLGLLAVGGLGLLLIGRKRKLA